MADEIRWLSFLCGITSSLLVLQLILGVATRSLTLIADTPHAAVDCLTYAFQYWIECAKVKSQTCIHVCGKPVLPWKVDIGASVISVLVQACVTAFIIVEAVDELQDPEAVPESIDVYQFRGSVLLFFAVVSTVSNIMVLLMRTMLKPKKKQKGDSDKQQSEQEIELQNLSEPCESTSHQCTGKANWNYCGHDHSHSMDSMQFCAPCGTGSKVFFANLDNTNFSGQGSQGRQCESYGDQHGCSHSYDQETDSPPLRVFIDNEGHEDQMNWQDLLHNVVHPGCDGNHGAFSHGHSHGNSQDADTERSASSGDLNLNAASATLHLVSDIFRSIVIFIVAVMIKCNIVHSARKADAICALLVAGFILMGALALFRKAFSVFGCRCLGGGHMYKAFIEVDAEAQ